MIRPTLLLLLALGCSQSTPGVPTVAKDTAQVGDATGTSTNEPRAPKVKTFDFKGAFPGKMTLEEFKKEFPSASQSEHEPGITSWTLQETIANQPATAGYWFVDGVLAEVFLGVKNGVPVRTALADKYGDPSSRTKDVWEWDGVDGMLRYDDLDGTPTVLFSDKKLMKEIEHRRAEAHRDRREQNAKDL